MNFLIPWIPVAKKNDVQVVPVRMGDRVFHKPVPSARVKAEQHAIGVLFSATREHDLGHLPDRDFDRIRALAMRRRERKTRVGPKTLEAVDPHSDGAVFEEGRDVAMGVCIYIGKRKDDDRVVVELHDVGLKTRRHRSGRSFDAINVPAIVADALKGRAFPDDRNIVELTVRVVHDD